MKGIRCCTSTVHQYSRGLTSVFLALWRGFAWVYYDRLAWLGWHLDGVEMGMTTNAKSNFCFLT